MIRLRMEILRSESVAPGEWDRLVGSSDDAWLYHSWEWIEMTREVFSLQNHYFLARENKAIVGGLPLQLVLGSRHGRPCNRAASVLMGSAGPLCERGLPSKLRRRVLSELTDAAMAWARGMDVEVLSCSLPPLAHANLHNVRGVNPLVATGWRDVSTHTRIIDLSRPESDLWAGLSQDARRSIKLARSLGYSVERAPWPEMLQEYYRVHEETYRRTHISPHPKSYFEGIATRIAGQGRAVLWTARDRDGRPVAFHNCARFGNGSLYWTGCCRTDHLRSGVNYMLFWRALTGAKEDGCEWYESGEAFPGSQDDEKLRGLNLFKGKFGGELYRYYRGEIRLFDPPSPLLFRAKSFLRRSLRGWLDRMSRESRGPSRPPEEG